jgi:hypothetical protein
MVENERPRSGCLTVYLVLMIVFSLLGAVQYLAMGGAMRQTMAQLGTTLPGWYLPVMGVFSLASVATAVGIWQWKRWGVYGFVGISLLSLVINLVAGISPGFSIIASVVGLAILFYLVRPLWDHFE